MQNALIKKLNNKKRKLIYSKLNFIVPATDDLSALENISGLKKILPCPRQVLINPHEYTSNSFRYFNASGNSSKTASTPLIAARTDSKFNFDISGATLTL